MLRRLALSDAARRRLLLAAIGLVLFALWLGVFLRMKPATPRMTIDRHAGPAVWEFSPDSRFLIARGRPLLGTTLSSRSGAPRPTSSIRIRHPTSGQSLGSFTEANDAVGQVVVAPNGRHVAFQSLNAGRWLVHEVGSGLEITTFPTVANSPGYSERLEFSPDGRTVAYVDSSRLPGKERHHHSVVLWDLMLRMQMRAFHHNRGPVCFSPDGAILASCRADDEEKAPCAVRLWESKNGTEIATLEGPDRRPLYMQFSPDGRFLAAVVETNEGRTAGNPARPQVVYHGVVLWSLKSLRLVRRWPRGRRFSFLPEENLLCLVRGEQGWGGPFASEEYRLPVHDEEPELVRRGPLLAFSHTGRYGLITHTDIWQAHPFRRWAMESLLGKQVPNQRETTSIQLTDWQGRTWQIETDGRTYAQLSPDEKTLLVSHQDGRVELYDVPPARPVAAFALFSAVASLLFTFALWWRFGR